MFLLLFVGHFLNFFSLTFFFISYDRESFIFIVTVKLFDDFVFLSCSLLYSCIFTDFWSFWDLPRHQNGVHRSRFPPFWEVLGGIWGRPCELLRASWPQRRPRCPQELQRRLQEASQTPPEASQRHPRDAQENENCSKVDLFIFFITFCAISLSLCYASTPARRNARSD